MADTAAQTYEDLGYDRIFVSLDGSDQQDKVLDRAILLAANDNAELYIGHVIDSTALEAAGTFPVDIVPSLEKEFRASIEAKVRAAEANPSIKKVEVIVRSGRIRETIKDEMLDVINPDLVICGARGLSSIKYAILGSISTFLTRKHRVRHPRHQVARPLTPRLPRPAGPRTAGRAMSRPNPDKRPGHLCQVAFVRSARTVLKQVMKVR